MADINSNLPVRDTADGTPGSASPALSQQVGGTDGTNLRTLLTDVLGRLVTSPRAFTYLHPIYTTRIQTVNNANSSNSTTLAATISPSTAGNALIVLATAAAGTLTCSDSAAQTYSTATSITSGTKVETIFYVANSAAGVSSVTITSTSSTALNIIVAEYSNITTVTPLDKVASQSNSGLTWTTPATTTTAQANELLIGGAFDISKNTSSFTAGTGYNAVNSINNGVGAAGGGIFLQERYVNATGAYTSSGSVSASDTVLAAIATFKISSYPSNFVILNTPITVKGSSGTLGAVTINSIGTTGATVSFYDGSVSNGTSLGTLNLNSVIGDVQYNLKFLTSLIMVVNSSTADFTLTYD